MFNRILTLVTLAAAIVLLFLMQTTSPSSSGPGAILTVFIMFYLVCFGVLTYLLRFMTLALSNISKPIVVKRPIRPMSLMHASYLASILAMGPIMLVGISSVGKMGGYEIILVVLFVVLGTFYVQKRLS